MHAVGGKNWPCLLSGFVNSLERCLSTVGVLSMCNKSRETTTAEMEARSVSLFY